MEEITLVSVGDSILTNLAVGADGSGKHYASVEVTIGYDNTQKKVSEEFGALLHEYMPVARSVVLACLYSSTYEELRDPDGPAVLADLIKRRLQEEFSTKLIVAVYLDNWLWQ